MAGIEYFEVDDTGAWHRRYSTDEGFIAGPNSAAELIESLNTYLNGLNHRPGVPSEYMRPQDWADRIKDQAYTRGRILRSAQEDINEEWHFTLRDMNRAWDHKIKIAVRRMDRRIAEIGTPDLPMKPKGRRVSRAEIEKYQKEHRG